MKKHFYFIFLTILLNSTSIFSQVTKNIFINTNYKNNEYFFNDKKLGYCLTKNIDGNYKISGFKIINQDTLYQSDISGITPEYNVFAKINFTRGHAKTVITVPLYYRKGDTIFKVNSINISLKEQNGPIPLKVSYADSSVLSKGKWIKVKLSSDGIYKISYSDLIDMGFSNPHNVRVFGYSGGMLSNYVDDSYIDDLPEVPVYYAIGNDGEFGPGDYILFYAQSPNKWFWSNSSEMMLFSWNLYDSYSYYFITCDQGIPKQIEYATPLSGTPTSEATNTLLMLHTSCNRRTLPTRELYG